MSKQAIYQRDTEGNVSPERTHVNVNAAEFFPAGVLYISTGSAQASAFLAPDQLMELRERIDEVLVELAKRNVAA